MMLRNKQKHRRQTHTYLLSAALVFPSLLYRFGPERRARPAAKASASTSPCRHGCAHTHAGTQTSVHASRDKQANISKVRICRAFLSAHVLYKYAACAQFEKKTPVSSTFCRSPMMEVSQLLTPWSHIHTVLLSPSLSRARQT